MATTGAKTTEAKAAQRQAAKRATFEVLRNKKPAEREFEITLSEGDDPVSFLFRSIGSTAYDKLLLKHPPTTDQKAEGATYNMDTFAPALLSMVCVEPVLDASEWKEIWTSPDWNRGEVGQMFWNAVELCNKGLEIAPIAAG